MKVSKQDMECMKDMILHNLVTYTGKEIAQCIQEGIFTMKELQNQIRIDTVWKDDDNVEILKLS